MKGKLIGPLGRLFTKRCSHVLNFFRTGHRRVYVLIVADFWRCISSFTMYYESSFLNGFIADYKITVFNIVAKKTRRASKERRKKVLIIIVY